MKSILRLTAVLVPLLVSGETNADPFVYAAPVVVYPVAPPPPRVVLVPPAPVAIVPVPVPGPRVFRRAPVFRYGDHAGGSPACLGTGCTGDVTRTGPYGNSVSRSGTASCAHGSCTGTRTITGPNGQSRTFTRTRSR